MGDRCITDHPSPITDHRSRPIPLSRQALGLCPLTSRGFHLERACGARFHVMSAAANFLEDAGALNLTPERLEHPLDTVALANDDFGQRVLSRRSVCGVASIARESQSLAKLRSALALTFGSATW
jgi:hypothetical protein